jgi:hypothetical protein
MGRKIVYVVTTSSVHDLVDPQVAAYMAATLPAGTKIERITAHVDGAAVLLTNLEKELTDG